MSTCRNCGGPTTYENDFCTACEAKHRRFTQENGLTGPGAATPFDICYWSANIEHYKRDLIREGKTNSEIQGLVKARIEDRKKKCEEGDRWLAEKRQREAEIARLADQI